MFSKRKVARAISRGVQVMIRRSIRRHRTGEYRRILCPTDFSSVADIGTEQARRLAVRDRAALVLLHVYIPAAFYMPPEAAGVALIRADAVWRAEAERELCRARDRLRESGAATHAVMVDGHPPDQIARVARRLRCDLIVLATRGRTGLLRLLLGGSVTERVIRRAPCPVLAYCAPQPPRAHGRTQDLVKAAA